MTRETIRDHIPWDDYYETRDTEEYKSENLNFLSSPNKKTVHHTKLNNLGIKDLVEEVQDKVTKLDFELQHIRDEMTEIEARRINAIAKQSKRK